MKKVLHGNPINISNGKVHILERVDDFSEKQIQDLIFEYPESLPLSDIDEAYNPLIPVCKELWTPVGPLDILMLTPNGDLAIIETKLWYNPEARRKVIAQILDYAKELSKWTYSDLQREVNKRTGSKGNSLYRFSLSSNPDNHINEIDFVDSVSRNLRLGRFLLLIVGDGIREGAREITEFITRYGNLNFSLALIELSIYKNSNNDTIIFPHINAKTIEIQKFNIEIAEGLTVISDTGLGNDTSSNNIVSEEVKTRREHFTKFWTEYIDQLELDDPGQALPAPARSQNLYLYPGNDKYSWISAYFSQSTKRVGVYFRFHSNPIGLSKKEQLNEYKEDIKNEVGDQTIWSWEDNPTDAFGVRLQLDDVYSKANKQKIVSFFNEWINRYVNVIRPRLKQIE